MSDVRPFRQPSVLGERVGQACPLVWGQRVEMVIVAHGSQGKNTALSEPQADETWTGQTGFVHDVLLREYLSTHPDPKSVEYYLCGPPAMMKAAREMLAGLGVGEEQIACDEF